MDLQINNIAPEQISVAEATVDEERRDIRGLTSADRAKIYLEYREKAIDALCALGRGEVLIRDLRSAITTMVWTLYNESHPQ